MFGYGCPNILRVFRDGNVIVAGHKGRGKDLLFQYVISAREKAGESHAANIRFTDKTTIRPVSFYKLHNNTYKNFISGIFKIEDKAFTEKEDFYISDVGTALPSQSWKHLDKEFATFPLVYALSRQLAQFNIHCNVQNFNRLWDKLREHGDYYIVCERCKVLFKRIAFQTVTLYTRYQSALTGIQPYVCQRRFFGLFPPKPEDLARANEHRARYGTIRRYRFWHILPKKPYDTREFHRLIYGKDAPQIGKKKKDK